MAWGPLLVLVAFSLGTLRAQTTPSAAENHITSDAPTRQRIKSSLNTTIETSAPNPGATKDIPATHPSTAEPEASLSPMPPKTTGSINETRNGTTGPTMATALASSKEALTITSQKAESTSNSTVTDGPGGTDEAPLSQKPGLVAVICIFLSILLIGAIVIVVKCYRTREPAFQKLDEVPMQGKAAEDSPFARYPPK
ncbi:mucin-5AC-like [Sceloporus undulatus]|uniref:mucin-5AC-like n=1 Tax=Sceloporus undulatus TaxID=8520 RepID=UPI001C4C927B|nr:mucin-5AC-like [Sceloporus undulatus]